MQTTREYEAFAEQRLLEGDLPAALHAFAALVRLDPTELTSRLRLGDALLGLGYVQEAAEVYAALARHASNAGHPLHALVALKLLEALEPELRSLLGGLAKLYAKGAPRLGPSVRLSIGLGPAPLPPGFAPNTAPAVDELVPVAAAIGKDYASVAAYPERVPPIPLFSELPADAFAAVLGAMRLVRARAGETIIAEGDSEQAFYVLARGEVSVTRAAPGGAELALATLHPGAIFGEMALVSALPRTATVRAESACDLLEFDRAALTAASEHVTTIADALDAFARERVLSNLLSTSPLFRPLERSERLDLARRFAAVEVERGTPIIVEGTEGQGLYVLVSGEAEVWKRDGDERVLLATLRPGDVFGEISLTRATPTSASVTAVTRATLLFLARDLFERIAAAIPSLARFVEELGDERSMDTRLLLSDATPTEALGDDELIFL